MTAVAYLGWYRTTEVEIEVSEEDVRRGYAEVGCFECEGTGWWAYMEPEEPGGPCVTCKGTGKVYVNC